MKYILLVSHGLFAPGLHSALNMLAGENREDILSVSLENGMSSEIYADNVRKAVSVISKNDEIILFADLVGGSPLTIAANILAETGLIRNTTMIGGMNFPLVINAAMLKDSMDIHDLKAMMMQEAKDAIKEFEVEYDDDEDEI